MDEMLSKEYELRYKEYDSK